jgi:hypothetical protein
LRLRRARSRLTCPRRIVCASPPSWRAVPRGSVICYVATECPFRVCAVKRRRFPVGASPTRQPLQPEATGAVMEATKWLKPLVSVSRYTVTIKEACQAFEGFLLDRWRIPQRSAAPLPCAKACSASQALGPVRVLAASLNGLHIGSPPVTHGTPLFVG